MYSFMCVIHALTQLLASVIGPFNNHKVTDTCDFIQVSYKTWSKKTCWAINQTIVQGNETKFSRFVHNKPSPSLGL